MRVSTGVISTTLLDLIPVDEFGVEIPEELIHQYINSVRFLKESVEAIKEHLRQTNQL